MQCSNNLGTAPTPNTLPLRPAPTATPTGGYIVFRVYLADQNVYGTVMPPVVSLHCNWQICQV